MNLDEAIALQSLKDKEPPAPALTLEEIATYQRMIRGGGEAGMWARYELQKAGLNQEALGKTY